jgi:hypothetical protein
VRWALLDGRSAGVDDARAPGGDLEDAPEAAHPAPG